MARICKSHYNKVKTLSVFQFIQLSSDLDEKHTWKFYDLPCCLSVLVCSEFVDHLICIVSLYNFGIQFKTEKNESVNAKKKPSEKFDHTLKSNMLVFRSRIVCTSGKPLTNTELKQKSSKIRFVFFCSQVKLQKHPWLFFFDWVN